MYKHEFHNSNLRVGESVPEKIISAISLLPNIAVDYGF